jgi:hypothetical protein
LNWPMTSTGSANDAYADHWRFVVELKEKAPIGSKSFMRHLNMRQPRVYQRIRNELIGMSVVRFQGGRGGSSSLVPGEVEFEQALAAGFEVREGRETALYRHLMDPIDHLITEFHHKQGHVVLESEESDGVVPSITSARSVKSHEGSFTRPDITVLAHLSINAELSWTDVHVIEVKPYWSLGRNGLFEAAAQATLQRCSFAWLVAYIPDAELPGMSRADRVACEEAHQQLIGMSPKLLREAASIGIGVAVAKELREGAALIPLADPRRQAMDPVAFGDLLKSLDR